MTSGKGDAIVQKVTSDSIMRRSKVEGEDQVQYRKTDSIMGCSNLKGRGQVQAMLIMRRSCIVVVNEIHVQLENFTFGHGVMLDVDREVSRMSIRGLPSWGILFLWMSMELLCVQSESTILVNTNDRAKRFHNSAFRIPHSAFRIPHSAFDIRHSKCSSFVIPTVSSNINDSIMAII